MRFLILLIAIISRQAIAAATVPIYYYQSPSNWGQLPDLKRTVESAVCSGKSSCSFNWIVKNQADGRPWRVDGTATYMINKCYTVSNPDGPGTVQQCRDEGPYNQSGYNISWYKNGCADGLDPDTTKPADQQCADPDPCKAKLGQRSGKGHYDVGTNPKIYASACQAGCLANWDGDDVGFTRLQSGIRHYYAYGEYVNAGSKCTASDTQPEVPLSPAAKSSDGKPAANSDGTNPGPCGSGESSGTVNNKPVCLKKDTTSGITFVTPTSNPNNAVGQTTGTVTTGDNTSPADGSYENYCRSHGTITICSGTAFDSASGTSGTGSSTGSGEGETSTGTGTGSSGSGTGTGTGTGTVNCPGCATESTLAAIKGILDPAGKDGKGATDGAGKAEDAFKPVEDSLLALKSGNGPFASLSLTFPPLFPAASECQKPSVNVLKQTMEIDTCYWIDLARQALGWVCYCLTVITLFRIATGGNKQGDK